VISLGAPLNSPVAAATNSQPQNAPAPTYTVNNAAGAADETPTAERNESAMDNKITDVI
jgi:hypothetical protein